MIYKKLKTISLKLDDKIKNELLRNKHESVPLSDNKSNLTKISLVSILLSKIKLRKLKIAYFSILSFFVDITITASEQFFIIFGDPAESFNLLYSQHGRQACPVPYSQFKQKQKHAKVFSLAGITTIILVTVMSSLLVNLMVGPIERTLAATYYWTQASWSGGTSGTAAVHGTDNNDWSYYASKDAGIVAGTNLALTSSSGDAGDATTFNTNTSADSSLSVASNSVTLLKPLGAACGAGLECESGACDTVCVQPCGASTICGDSCSYGGQSYATVALGSQCWFSENLNIGTMCTETTCQTDNAQIDKWCLNSNEISNGSEGCFTGTSAGKGGLYQWDEAMQYAATCNGTGSSQPECSTPVQGICPSGWHIPSHYEVVVLEREVCTSGTCVTDFPFDTTTTSYRGTDEGSRLAGNASLWSNGLIDYNGTGNAPFGSSGFNVWPSGRAGNNWGSLGFWNPTDQAYIWTSSQSSATYTWVCRLFTNYNSIWTGSSIKSAGLSIRCLKD
jgi:uncharacterized protein (TIGR02145 family)